MAINFDISSKEMLRVATAAYEGRKVEVFLANDPTSTLGRDSTYAAWKALELAAANGYAPYLCEIPAGAYDPVDLRHEIGAAAGYDQSFPAVFNGTGVGYSYDCVVAAIHESDGVGGWTAPTEIYGIYRAFPAETVFPGQQVNYPVALILSR